MRFLNDISDKKKRGGSISKFSSFTPLSSQALLDDVVRINISNIKLENYKSEPIEISPETKKMMTYSDQHNKLSDECNKLVSQIVRLTGETHKKVHYRSYEEVVVNEKYFLQYKIWN